MLLHRLAQAIEEKIASTRTMRLSSGRFELGTSALDVANYWFLHSLCSALPALRHHLQDRRSHPEEVYRDLARLAGALSTFSLESTPGRDSAIPASGPDFHFQGVGYSDPALSGNCGSIQHHHSPVPQSWTSYIYAAEVKDERCLRRSRWIFGVRSSLTDSADPPPNAQRSSKSAQPRASSSLCSALFPALSSCTFPSRPPLSTPRRTCTTSPSPSAAPAGNIYSRPNRLEFICPATWVTQPLNSPSSWRPQHDFFSSFSSARDEDQ